MDIAGNLLYCRIVNDKEIIALYREGRREEAFSAIVRDYSERLYWHVRPLVDSHEDTDDLLQEIFVKVWQALPSFRGDSRLFTWLWRIASNETLNFLRKRKVRSALMFRNISSSDECSIGDDPYFDGAEAERALMKSLSALPDKQRLVFSLRYFEDLRYEDISEITDTSVGSLKASYHIACEKIKADLRERGFIR